MKRCREFALWLRIVPILFASTALGLSTLARADIVQLEKDFHAPSADTHPMVRWWWFGPAVTKAGIERELLAMKAGGIGGVEVQPTYPLAVDGGEGDAAVKNLKFMSPEFLEMLGFAAAKCKELGLRMDLTLGSGWPYGGSVFSAAEGAKQIETMVVQAPAGQTHVVPAVQGGRVIVAAFAGPADAALGGGGRGRGRGAANGDMTAFKPVAIAKDGSVDLPAEWAGGTVLCFVYRQNIMAVKRPAFGAEGPVIDHLSANVIEKFIKQIAEPEIKACGANPPHAIFCDSLEINGENWTDDFLAEFQKRRGYDLTPYLPALAGNIGPRTADVRHDYGLTVTELFNDRFNARFSALAKQYGTLYRVQGYGSPAAVLSSYASSDLPEGELQQTFDFHAFRATRYAASASHLIGQKVTSSETFTWLHGAPFRAVPMDIKGEVDQYFLDGVNQIICHGWPYTENGMAYPGGSFYAAAVFDDKNPWYIAMPEVTGYVARVSQMMREGTPANDVAIYLPESDDYAGAGTGFGTMNAAFTAQGGILAALLNAGYNADAIDDGMLALKGKLEGAKLAFGDLKYGVVVLPATDRMPLATARQLDAFANAGGLVLALGHPPTIVPGIKATPEDQAQLAAIMGRLFSGANAANIVAAEKLGAAIAPRLPADVTLTPASAAVGSVHRHTDDADLYFLANTSPQARDLTATFRVTGKTPELWDPVSGKILPATFDGKDVSVHLEPYGSALVVWTNRQLAKPPAPAALPAVDLSTDWKVAFAGHGPEKTVDMPALASWTTLDGMKNFSGVGSYEKKVTLTAAAAKGPQVISFGPGKPMANGGRGGMGFAAAYESPVHDAAVVYINGTRAGAAWCAPFKVDVTGLLKEGENVIRIDVGNTAVNYISAAGFPNYDLAALRRVYGNRFDPQGMQLYAQPLVSGLEGPITLQTGSN